MRILENDNGLNGLLEVLGGGRKDGDRPVAIGIKRVFIVVLHGRYTSTLFQSVGEMVLRRQR